jgi:hypothetical protein
MPEIFFVLLIFMEPGHQWSGYSREIFYSQEECDSAGGKLYPNRRDRSFKCIRVTTPGSFVSLPPKKEPM